MNKKRSVKDMFVTKLDTPKFKGIDYNSDSKPKNKDLDPFTLNFSLKKDCFDYDRFPDKKQYQKDENVDFEDFLKVHEDK